LHSYDDQLAVEVAIQKTLSHANVVKLLESFVDAKSMFCQFC
jgi:hypothetical protein